MTDNYTIGEIMKYYLKKWIGMLVSIVACAVLLVVPQTAKNVNIQMQDIQSNLMISFNQHATVNDVDGALKHYDYRELFYRSTMLSEYCTLISEKYEMSRIVSGWDSMGGQAQLLWVQETILAVAVNNAPVYEFNVQLRVPQDSSEYALENAPRLLEDFAAQAAKSTSAMSADTSYKVLGQESQTTAVTLGTKVRSYLKYALVGAMLGFLIAAFAYALLFVAGRRVESIHWFRKMNRTEILHGADDPAYAALCYAVNEAGKQNKKMITLCSSIHSEKFVGGFLQSAAKLEARVAFADLTGRVELPVDTFGVTLLPAEISSLLKTPGQATTAIDQVAADFDYVVIYTEIPTREPVSVELAGSSAVVLFVERIGKSMKKHLEDSVEMIRISFLDTAICFVWDK